MPYKILVVDDEPDLKPLLEQHFRKQIKNHEFTFVFAENGVDALNKISLEKDVDLILTDINMPEMDGLTFLTRLQDFNENMISVVISAYGDMDNIRQAMNKGAYDFLMKPIEFKDLDITLTKAISENKKIKEALHVSSQFIAIQQELEIAKHIQQSMLPQALNPKDVKDRFNIFSKMIPAKKVGGDFYDYFFIDDNRLAFVIGDVADKGVPAAMYMVMSRMIIKSLLLANPDLQTCFAHINNILTQDNPSTMFVTVFCGIINLDSGKVEYVNAGHIPPLVISLNSEIKETETTDGIGLGVLDNFKFVSKEITIKPGDTILLVTDGVAEALSKENKLFSKDKLFESLAQSPNQPLDVVCNNLITDVRTHSRGMIQSDDITVFGLKYDGEAKIQPADQII
ncbi:MAG: SpoIIE family protein phosphatase [Ignavibacteriaceae bacterium]